MNHFADRLLDACARKGAPVCVGIDPVYDRLPDAVRGDDPVQAITNWASRLLEAVAEHVPCVKLQSACFERYHGAGVDAFEMLIAKARELDLLTIADVKRGDIGISAAHYAAANSADAMTINTYLGDDSIEPFINAAKENGTGLFALVRTSNPGGDALQQLELTDGRTVAHAVAQMVADLGAQSVGESGYSLLGAVVGATKPAEAAALRQLMPEQIFLVPGFGAQGGTADDVKACFTPASTGQGALITASRSVIFAHEQQPDVDWRQAVTLAAADLNQQIAALL